MDSDFKGRMDMPRTPAALKLHHTQFPLDYHRISRVAYVPWYMLYENKVDISPGLSGLPLNSHNYFYFNIPIHALIAQDANDTEPTGQLTNL